MSQRASTDPPSPPAPPTPESAFELRRPRGRGAEAAPPEGATRPPTRPTDPPSTEPDDPPTAEDPRLPEASAQLPTARPAGDPAAAVDEPAGPSTDIVFSPASPAPSAPGTSRPHSRTLRTAEPLPLPPGEGLDHDTLLSAPTPAKDLEAEYAERIRQLRAELHDAEDLLGIMRGRLDRLEKRLSRHGSWLQLTLGVAIGAVVLGMVSWFL